MWLTHSGNLVPSRSHRRLETDSTVLQAGVEFDHTDLVDGGFFAENENFFLCAVSVPRTRSKPSKLGGRDGEKRRGPTNRFEQLPYEIMWSVLERLDISSLVQVASVNKCLRALVQSLPDVKKIQRSIYSARAISRMYTTGTAKHFTVKQFVQGAFTSVVCGFCDRGIFGIAFCLVSCRRVCRDCQMRHPDHRYLPAEMAMQCFGLEYQEMTRSGGLARSPIPSSFRRATYHDRVGIPNFSYQRIDVTFLPAVIDTAVTKYEKYGGMLYVKFLVNDYLLKNDIDLEQSGDTLADRVFPGLEEGIRAYWEWVGVDEQIPKRLLMTSLPFLRPKTHPSILELGIRCEGCIRNAFYRNHLAFSSYEGGLWVDVEVRLKDEFSRHFTTCSTAQYINKGYFLSLRAEFMLIEILLQTRATYWPQEAQTPEEVKNFTRIWPARSDWTAKKFRYWHAKCLERMIDIGERQSKCKQQMAEFSKALESKGSSLSDLIFGFTGGARLKAIVGYGRAATFRREEASDIQRRRKGFRRTSRRINHRDFVPLVLQDCINNSPPWLLPLNVQESGPSEMPLQRKPIFSDRPRCEETMFKSGNDQIVEAHSEGATSITPTTHDDKQVESRSFGNQFNALVDGLQKLGIAPEKASIQGLWEIRIADEEDADESDEDYDVRKGDEGDEGQEEDDSNEEL